MDGCRLQGCWTSAIRGARSAVARSMHGPGRMRTDPRDRCPGPASLRRNRPVEGASTMTQPPSDPSDEPLGGALTPPPEDMPEPTRPPEPPHDEPPQTTRTRSEPPPPPPPPSASQPSFPPPPPPPGSGSPSPPTSARVRPTTSPASAVRPAAASPAPSPPPPLGSNGLPAVPVVPAAASPADGCLPAGVPARTGCGVRGRLRPQAAQGDPDTRPGNRRAPLLRPRWASWPTSSARTTWRRWTPASWIPPGEARRTSAESWGSWLSCSWC